MGKRVVIYVRISKDKVGAGLGVQRQRNDCLALLDRLGWTLAETLGYSGPNQPSWPGTYVDNDVSAYTGKPRRGYRHLLAALTEGRADAIVSWHTDRLHRSPVELEEFISTCEPRAVPTHCVKAGPLDLSSPSGRLVARQLGAVARYEVEHMVERQKAAKAQAAAAGKFRGGRRAFGYGADGVTVRPDEAAVVRDMADRVLAGESVRSIAARLNQAGSRGTLGGEWTGASVRDVLIRYRNAALIEHDGQEVGPALWEPLLDEPTWRTVRGVLTDPRRSPSHDKARRWLGSGLYLCGLCGLTVRIGSGGRNRTSMRPYYRCSGATMHVSRVADHVDSLVRDVIVGRLAHPDAAALLAPPADQPDTAALHADANALRAELDELAADAGARRISARQMAIASEPLQARLDEITTTLDSTRSWAPLAKLAAPRRPASTERWGTLTLDEKRTVVDLLISVTILPGKLGRKPGGIYFDPETVQIDWRV